MVPLMPSPKNSGDGGWEKKESNRSIDFGQLIGGISLARRKRELKDQWENLIGEILNVLARVKNCGNY